MARRTFFVCAMLVGFYALGILVGGVYLVVDKATFKPQYASTARVFLAKEYSSSGSGSSAEDINKYTLGLKLVYDCTYMLKSNVYFFGNGGGRYGFNVFFLTVFIGSELVVVACKAIKISLFKFKNFSCERANEIPIVGNE